MITNQELRDYWKKVADAVSDNKMQTSLPPDAARATKQDSMIAALGAPTDSEATGNGSIVGILKRLRTLLGDSLVTLGSAIGNKAQLIAGSDGTNARAIKTASDGTLLTQLTGSNVILLDRFPVTVTAGALAYNVISNLNVKNYKSLSVIITTNSVHTIDVGFVWKKSDGTTIVVETAANKTIVGGWGQYKNINEAIVHGDLFNIHLSNQDTVDRVYTITVVGHGY